MREINSSAPSTLSENTDAIYLFADVVAAIGKELPHAN